MIAAARIGRALDKLPEQGRARIEETIWGLGRLPLLDGLNARDVLQALQHDKKIKDGAVHFVLPRAIGQVEITPNVPFDLVRDVVKSMLHERRR
jgi:3-dehydroquinate synthase